MISEQGIERMLELLIEPKPSTEKEKIDIAIKKEVFARLLWIGENPDAGAFTNIWGKPKDFKDVGLIVSVFESVGHRLLRKNAGEMFESLADLIIAAPKVSRTSEFEQAMIIGLLKIGSIHHRAGEVSNVRSLKDFDDYFTAFLYKMISLKCFERPVSQNTVLGELANALGEYFDDEATVSESRTTKFCNLITRLKEEAPHLPFLFRNGKVGSEFGSVLIQKICCRLLVRAPLDQQIAALIHIGDIRTGSLAVVPGE